MLEQADRSTRNFQVLIVEDDPVIASIYKETVNSNPRLEVAGVVARGEDALMLLQRRHCDLVLIDLKLAGMNGTTLLKKLREQGNSIEAIVVTACRRSEVVRSMIQRGAVDYLVKPFTVERLRQSLSGFLHRVSALHDEQLDQAAIDRVCAAGRESMRWLPKGLTEDGISKVRQALRDEPAGCSAAEIAEATDLARVTARRYLEFLVSTDQASVEPVATGPGRPRKLYQWRPQITVGLVRDRPAAPAAMPAGAVC